MASDCEIVLDGLPAARAREVAAACEAEVRRIEAKYSRYREDSATAAINRAAARGEPVSIDTETAALCRFAGELHALSHGLFDLTSGVLRHAWRFDRPERPDPARLADLLSRVGWNHVQLSADRIGFSIPGMELDFGGIGKEYAADRAAVVAQEAGAAHGLINLGGDIAVIGPPADGAAWSLGIRHPRQPEATLAHVDVTRGALATSGDYERFIMIDGRRFCHIINPRSGQPVQHWQSVSVVGTVCIAAGALASIAMLMEADALPWLRDQGAQFLAVGPDGRLING
jgi:thiamine biosynthesis lipoprotein